MFELFNGFDPKEAIQKTVLKEQGMEVEDRKRIVGARGRRDGERRDGGREEF